MFLFKKVLVWGGLLALIYGGSAGTQSSSLFVQGMSFIGLLIIAIILFVFGKMLVRGLGCMPSVLVMAAIGVFMMYALGMFNNGVGGVIDAISRFIGREQVQTQTEAQEEPGSEATQEVQEERAETKAEQNNMSDAALFDDYKPKEEQQKKQTPGLLGNLVSALSGKKPVQEQRPFNPIDYPVVYITPRIISGDTFEVGGRYFRLFGISAPIANQTCTDGKGRAYRCGKQAALWLKEWIEGEELECHVIQQDTNGNMVGTCAFGPYDISAALVNAGWAVANPKYADAYAIYVVYEEQAQKNRRGLWEGQFYKPWDWQKMQNRKGTVKIIRPKKRKPGLFG